MAGEIWIGDIDGNSCTIFVSHRRRTADEYRFWVVYKVVIGTYDVEIAQTPKILLTVMNMLNSGAYIDIHPTELCESMLGKSEYLSDE